MHLRGPAWLVRPAIHMPSLGYQMSYLADDSAAIEARMEEIAAEKRLALTGSTAEEPKETKEFDDYGMYAYPTGYTTFGPVVGDKWKYDDYSQSWVKL